MLLTPTPVWQNSKLRRKTLPSQNLMPFATLIAIDWPYCCIHHYVLFVPEMIDLGLEMERKKRHSEAAICFEYLKMQCHPRSCSRRDPSFWIVWLKGFVDALVVRGSVYRWWLRWNVSFATNCVMHFLGYLKLFLYDCIIPHGSSQPEEMCRAPLQLNRGQSRQCYVPRPVNSQLTIANTVRCPSIEAHDITLMWHYL